MSARVLGLGSYGADVARLQRRLGVAADSNFGPATRAAVIAYQRAQGLVPDGLVGPETQLLLNGGLPETAAASSWGRGVIVQYIAAGWVITSGYGPRGAPPKPHPGIDIAGPGWETNAPAALSAVSGEVVGVNADAWGQGYGTWIDIRWDDNPAVVIRYAHLEYRTVDAGDRVSAGQVIGRYGKTGHSFGVHLHLEVLVNGQRVNPADWIRIEDQPVARRAA